MGTAAFGGPPSETRPWTPLDPDLSIDTSAELLSKDLTTEFLQVTIIRLLYNAVWAISQIASIAQQASCFILSLRTPA